MRLLADENFPGSAVQALREAGHDIVWIRSEAPGASDHQVLVRAQDDARLLVTFDKDFGELAFLRGARASRGVVLFRVPPASPAALASLVVMTLGSRSDWEDNFTVVEPGRLRMRRLPLLPAP